MSLAPLYVKAAVSAVGPRATALPETVLHRSAEVDRGHLAAYARVCGYPVDDVLPATYPHVLAFPLQVELMAARSFPVPLPGLVHVANTITVHRAITAGERLEVRVRAERFAPHPKGAQVDLVAEVDAGGERVWDGRSTYLARGVRARGAAGLQRGDTAPVGLQQGDTAAIGDLAPTAVWRVPGDTGRRYAAVSGDANPIHLHPLAARAFGFPRAIAHGMWTAARALAALQGRLAPALTYEVAFGRPLLLPSTVDLITKQAGDRWRLAVRSRRGEHLTAEVRPI